MSLSEKRPSPLSEHPDDVRRIQQPPKLRRPYDSMMAQQSPLLKGPQGFKMVQQPAVLKDSQDIKTNKKPPLSKGSNDVIMVQEPPLWKRPEDVMKEHRLKLKLRAQALKARLDGCSLPSQRSQVEAFGSSSVASKRKNPFSKSDGFNKKLRSDPITDLETSSDNSLFQLLSESLPASQVSQQTSFSCILSKLEDTATANEQKNEEKGKNYIPVDWSLKTKLRFMCRKPFAWTSKLRTCEEASGITGFVRCLNTGLSPQKQRLCTLDTSPNARFHQCCLVWQHPVIPWLTLFPRSSGKVSEGANSPFASDIKLRDCMHSEWVESFRSLFQLLRACQCPYFYVCANTFTCLFRAAGICGYANTHAFITPSTRGFRQTLRDEDVIFTMPLKKKRQSLENSNDTGYETQDSVQEETQKDEEEEDDEDDDDEEESDKWLASMGVSADEIRRLNSQHTKKVHKKEGQVDRTPESTLFVEGIEAQALFNFLMNCKSAVATTGPLAGVPPTLLSPVAFHGATLKPLKVRQTVVKADNASFHSIEVRGPILPHTIHDLCGLLQQSSDEFSATFAQLESTRAFTMATHTQMVGGETSLEEVENSPTKDLQSPLKQGSEQNTCITPTKAPPAFGKENLSDCGLHPHVLKNFCSSDSNLLQSIDCLKYNTDRTYTW